MRFTGSTPQLPGGAPDSFRRACLEAAVVAFAGGAAFFATASRDLAAGDSGELLLAARTFGIPHPPGYPVWVLLAGLFGMVPAGTFALRVALLSVVAASAGLGILYLLMRRCGLERPVCAASTLALAFTPQFWSSAGSVEVYPLAFAVDAALAWATWNYAELGGRARLFACAALAGLAMVSHQSAVLFLPLLFVVTAPRMAKDGIRGWAAAAAGLVTGLLPFAWLPLRSAQHPALDWGHDADLARLFANLSRASYGQLAQHGFTWGRLGRELSFFGRQQVAEWGPGMVFAALAGFVLWAVKCRRGAMLGLVALASLPVGLALTLNFEPDPTHAYQLSQFLMPVSAVMAIAIAHGLSPLLRSWARVPALAALAAWVVGGAAMHYPLADQHDLHLARHYGEDLLAGLPRGATLFVEGDNETFTVAYLQKAEGLRRDVRVIHRKGYVFEDPYGLAALPRREWPARQRAVEASLLATIPGPVFATSDMPLPDGFGMEPRGLLSRVVRGGVRPGARPVPALSADLARVRRADFVTRKLAVSYLECEARERLEQGSLDQAVVAYRRLAYVAYDFPEAHYDLSRLLLIAGQREAARAEFLTALLLAPQEAWLREEGRKMGFVLS